VLADATAGWSRRETRNDPRGALGTLARAREPIGESERQTVYDVSRGIAALALLDTLADPSPRGATSDALRVFLLGASAERLAVLLERVHARDAHGIVEGLARTGLIDAETAQVAHARIDLRAAPDADTG
jgi:hypothetical protein